MTEEAHHRLTSRPRSERGHGRIIMGLLLVPVVLMGSLILQEFLSAHTTVVTVFRYSVYLVICWWGPCLGGLTGVSRTRVRILMGCSTLFIELFAVQRMIRF